MRKSAKAVLVTLLIAVSVALTIHFSAHRPNIEQTAFLMLMISGSGCIGTLCFLFGPTLNENEVTPAVFSTLMAIMVFSFLTATFAMLGIWSEIASNFF